MISVVWLCQLFTVVGRLVNFFWWSISRSYFIPPSISHFDLVERKKGKFCHDFFYWGHNLIFYVSHSPQCIIATFLIWPSNFYIINFTVEKCLSIFFCWVKTENWRIDLLYVGSEIILYVCVIVSKDSKASRKVHASWFKSKYQFSLSTSCN